MTRCLSTLSDPPHGVTRLQSKVGQCQRVAAVRQRKLARDVVPTRHRDATLHQARLRHGADDALGVTELESDKRG